eukprot:jgi/Galph1/4499/GphlegSOOS_G3196.1
MFYERPLKERLALYLRTLKPNRGNLWEFFSTFLLAYAVTGTLLYLRHRPSPFPYWSKRDPPYDEKDAKARYKDTYDGVYWPLPNDSEEFYQFLLERENDIFEYQPRLEFPYPEPFQSRFQAYREKHAVKVQKQMRREMAEHFRNLEEASAFFNQDFS